MSKWSNRRRRACSTSPRLAAVRKWTYEPRKENGVPSPRPAQARLVFDLAN